jgi:hypothetical protein
MFSFSLAALSCDQCMYAWLRLMCVVLVCGFSLPFVMFATAPTSIGSVAPVASDAKRNRRSTGLWIAIQSVCPELLPELCDLVPTYASAAAMILFAPRIVWHPQQTRVRVELYFVDSDSATSYEMPFTMNELFSDQPTTPAVTTGSGAFGSGQTEYTYSFTYLASLSPPASILIRIFRRLLGVRGSRISKW